MGDIVVCRALYSGTESIAVETLTRELRESGTSGEEGFRGWEFNARFGDYDV